MGCRQMLLKLCCNVNVVTLRVLSLVVAIMAQVDKIFSEAIIVFANSISSYIEDILFNKKIYSFRLPLPKMSRDN